MVSLLIEGLEELSKSALIAVTAADLAREFARDKEAAAKKYNEMTDVVVTGEVVEVGKKNDFEYARLKGDGKVGVKVNLQAGEMQYLKQGQTAQLRSNLVYPPTFANDEVSIDAGFVLSAR